MSKKKQEINVPKEYYSMAEVAYLLGVSKSLIKKRIYEDKTLKTVMVMGVVRIHRNELARHGVKFGDAE